MMSNVAPAERDVRATALRDAISVVERHRSVDLTLSASIQAIVDDLTALAASSAVERIERAAIRNEGVVYDVPRPGRHHHVVRMICSMGKAGIGDGMKPVEPGDGFLTSHGRFVDRDEGYRVADAAGQIIDKSASGHIPGHLFSEDLW